jgi:subtilisin family serine protease
MKKILSSAVLVLLFANLSFAQSQPLYFDNTIIIKYESEERLQKINPNGTVAIQQEVEEYLSSFGLTEVKPLWNNSLENQLRRTLSEKRKTVPNPELTSNLQRIYEYSYSGEYDPLMLAQKLSTLPGIEYAEPRFIRQTIDVLATNDPFKNALESLHKFNEAWEITTGSSDVIIGIVDSGVNYNNVDLKNKGWVNDDEIPDNGIDDDENGFIDDYIGWDFWESGGFNSIPLVRDNDPFSEFSDHGAHVAGIATAEANNSIGIAGTGFNSRYMAIKAGGIEDIAGTEIDESRLVGFGYDGIIYGVVNGADIINNSWGGAGTSNAEADVIEFAVDAGVVIIAAQGNDGSTGLQSPASYDGVLGVGSLTANATMSGFSNYGYSVDVFAQGSGVQSVAGTDSTSFGSKSGTSMASPAVAGLAGLLKAQYPDWSPRRIIHQIRSTSVPFDSNEDPLLLGKGMIDAEAALTTLMPGLSLRNFDITDRDGTSLSVGESGIVDLRITNFGETTGNLVVSFEVLQDNITITSNPVDVGVLATDQGTNVQVEFDIPGDYDLNDPPTFVVRYEDASLGYTDFEVFQFDNLNFGVMEANNVTMSFGANGTIGFSDPSAATGGIGFIPEGYTNILYEAGIMMMAGGSPFTNEEPKLSNNVRGVGFYDSDFSPNTPFAVDTPEEASAEGTGTFTPNRFAELKGIRVRLNASAFQDPALENAVYTQYQIKNESDEPIEDFYFGIFTDWDVRDFRSNTVIYDPSNKFMYIYDASEGHDYPFIAVDALQGTSSILAIDNAYAGNETDYRFNLYDGYSDEEKRNSLIASTNATGASLSDVSTVVASGPYTFNPGVTIKIGFTYVYGADYPDLRSNILAARDNNVFDVDEPGVYTSSELDSDVPRFTNLSQNYPNPFNPSTELNFELAEGGLTELSIYNILGQKVQTLVNEVRAAGSYRVNFDASRLNSGIYFAVLKSGDFTQSIKMTLIK